MKTVRGFPHTADISRGIPSKASRCCGMHTSRAWLKKISPADGGGMSMSSEAAVVVTQTILGCWVSMATGTWDGCG